MSLPYAELMTLQPTFIENICAAYGESGKIWLEKLSSHLEALATHWDFRFIRAFSELSYNFVALVELNSTGELVILKTAPNEGSIVPEVHWLQHFNGVTPYILKVDEERNAFLMEYLDPGNSLKSLVKNQSDETATIIICQTILALKSTQPIPASFKHLSQLTESLPLLKEHIESSMLSRVESQFRELSTDRIPEVLLHGDLHHDNILQSGSSWKIIDPHGYRGDPAAEVGPMIHNPHDCFPMNKPLQKTIEARLKILAECLPFDPQRMQAWAFCLTLLSAAWDIEGSGKITNNKIAIAQAIIKTKV